MSPRRPRSASADRAASRAAARATARAAERRSANGRAAAGAGDGLDWLRLRGIEAYGHLGVTQKEREMGQRLEADVEIAYTRETERRPDSIDAYVDYEELSRLVRGQIAMARCRLLETLAEEVALALLAEFDPPRVRVRLRKLHVPVADFSGCPEVEVERVRS
jgi:7,8-dihydroneopterin aldolase/epimerase/oxygenase